MQAIVKKFTKHSLQSLLVAVPVAVLAICVIAPVTTYAVAAACYNKLGGSLPYQCVDNDEVPAGTVIEGGKFDPDKCYVFADPGKGWQLIDCADDVFAQQLRGAQPIPSANDPANQKCTVSNCDLMQKVINPLIKFFAAALGIIVTISIVIGGIQYASSADDPQAVAKAKQRIITAVLALLGFIFLWAILQWLVPGGVT
jgi:hypothetical protein